VIGGPFQVFVDKLIDARNTKVAKQGNVMIEMDEEVYEAFKSSKQISSKSPSPQVLPFSNASCLLPCFSESRHRRQPAEDGIEAPSQ
jgi:hypothetical protein